MAEPSGNRAANQSGNQAGNQSARGAAVGALTIASAEVCDRGKVREENQDNVRSARLPLGDLFVVADGIGGYQGGATASRMVVEGFLGQLATKSPDYPPDRALQEACTYTNSSIFKTAGSSDPSLHRMGSTVVLALVQLSSPVGPIAWIGHVGDSRAYLIRSGRMQKITNDHSAVQSLLSRQLITEEEARNHPDASVLTRSLGHRPEVEIEVDRVPLEPGDSLLLCSDGLWGYVSDADVAAVVTESNLSVETIADTLLHQALAAGGQDNIGIEFARLSNRAARPAAIASAPSAQAEENRKSGLRTQLWLAIALLVLGGCGYLGYAAVKGNWLHMKDTTQQNKQSTSLVPIPAVDGSKAESTEAIPATKSADTSAIKPPRDPENHSAQTQDGTPRPRHEQAAVTPPPQSAPQVPAPPLPQPAAQSPSPAQPANYGKGSIAVVGELQKGQREIPAPPGTRKWKRVSITRESNVACVNHAKDKPQLYAGSNFNVVEVLQQLPDVGSHLQGVEQHEMTEGVRKDCGDFDAVIFLAAKHGSPSGSQTLQSPDSHY